MSAHSTFCRKLGLGLAVVTIATLPLAARASRIGIYTDETGSSCSFSGNNTGPVSAYIMITPDEGGLRGVRFSVPIPSCLGAVFVEDIKPAGGEIIGDSQSGISVAFGLCITTPQIALQINYYRNGSTEPCCEFPIQVDPIVGMIEGLDCSFQSVVVDPVLAHVNADASCECTQPANFAPAIPAQPSPADELTEAPLTGRLTWQSTDPENEPLGYDVYFGTGNPPPLVAENDFENHYTLSPLMRTTRYYWRVVARDPHNRETAGPVWTFVTRDNPPPYIPSNPLPPMASTARPLRLTLGWSCGDPDGDALTYDVYFGTVVSPPLVATGVRDVSWSPDELAAATTHHWKIVAHDPYGGITEGPVWSFETQILATFQAVALNEGINVTWRMATSEGMKSYTLSRNLTGSPEQHVVSRGTVSGNTGSYLDSSVEPNARYAYQLTVTFDDGAEFSSSTATAAVAKPSFFLGANRPNPFNPQTTIPYALLVGSHVRLAIYDGAGRLVRTLVDENQSYGPHAVVWDGKDNAGNVSSSGVYFCVLEANGRNLTQKMILLK